ncbi:MAG: hypothetical protein A2W00_01740 [Candidatus Eisenbacteria bacterium RBG_16_71_46]|nr:MAG: hypothetical protein A2W00_01740 [Candidatus Eisenbacteria bacterium RBG_16_71_46]
MAIAVRFSKARAEYLLGCIAKGEAIRPERGNRWTAADLLALAGAAAGAVAEHLAVKAHGTDWTKVPREHQEARWSTVRADMLAGIEWCASTTRMVRDGEYDQQFEPTHMVTITTGGGTKVPPVAGVKGAAGGGE